MKEYQKHIMHPHASRHDAICGAREIGFQFESIDHAFLECEREGRLLPCPDCLRIVIETLHHQ